MSKVCPYFELRMKGFGDRDGQLKKRQGYLSTILFPVPGKSEGYLCQSHLQLCQS